MTSLMLELLSLLLAALLIGWWCGSRYFRWRANRISETFEAVQKINTETKAQLVRELESFKEQVSLAQSVQETAQARAMEIESSLAAEEAAHDVAKADRESAHADLLRMQRKLVAAEQAIKALQSLRDESVNALGVLTAEAEVIRETGRTRQLELEQLQREREGLHGQAQENLRRLKELESDVLATLTRTAALPGGPVRD